MKKILLLLLLAGTFACKEKTKVPSLTDPFAKCKSNCGELAIQLKDLYQQDSRRVLEDFGKDTALLRRWVEVLSEAYFFNPEQDTELSKREVQQNMMMLASRLKSDAALKNTATIMENELSFIDIVSGSEGVSEDYLPLTGTYAYELSGNAGNGELKVSRIDEEHIRFSLMITGPAPAHNQGMMEGEAALAGKNVAGFKTSDYGGDCELRFDFDHEGVEIKTLGGDSAACGFGNGIRADNAYQIKSYDDPFLSGADARMAKNLQGTWQSTQDPKAEIQLDKGMFTSRYDGDVLDSFPYQFYPKCLRNCNTVATMPCFSVTGQDILCYTVVKADGKTLEISMINGKGNTLSYVRK